MMDISEVLLIPAAMTTAIMQLVKKMPVIKRLEAYFEWFALLIGMIVLYVWVHTSGSNLEMSAWDIIWNGLTVGFASIGIFRTAGTVSGGAK